MKRFILIDLEQATSTQRSDTEAIAEGLAHMLEATLGQELEVAAMSELDLVVFAKDSLEEGKGIVI